MQSQYKGELRVKPQIQIAVPSEQNKAVLVLGLAEEIIHFVRQHQCDEITAITALEVARVSFGSAVRQV